MNDDITPLETKNLSKPKYKPSVKRVSSDNEKLNALLVHIEKLVFDEV